MGYWWILAGFLSSKESAFFSIEPDMAGVLLGLHQSVSFKLLEGKETQRRINGQVVTNRSGQLKFRINPFGDAEYYSWRKNTNDNLALSEVGNSGYYSVLTVKRVCKGPLQYRTVRLFDDSPVQVCRGLDCYTSNKPSEAWVDEARLEATCGDGKVVTFQYGPIDSRSGRAGRSPVMGYFDDWLYQAWKKIPLGVQFKGNRSPVVTHTQQQQLSTRSDTPLQIDLSDWIRDPDGDRLTVRFLGQPLKGSLSPNPDGTFTYTPKPGSSGAEQLRYKVSDGLMESEDMGRILINVWKPAE